MHTERLQLQRVDNRLCVHLSPRDWPRGLLPWLDPGRSSKRPTGRVLNPCRALKKVEDADDGHPLQLHKTRARLHSQGHLGIHVLGLVHVLGRQGAALQAGAAHCPCRGHGSALQNLTLHSPAVGADENLEIITQARNLSIHPSRWWVRPRVWPYVSYPIRASSLQNRTRLAEG